jgi:hypothetical protein
MPWSPPTKIIVQISFVAQVIGIFFGLIGSGLIGLDRVLVTIYPAVQNPRVYGLIGTVICFFGWILMMLGVLFKRV